jgi:hypothetical protein
LLAEVKNQRAAIDVAPFQREVRITSPLLQRSGRAPDDRGRLQCRHTSVVRAHLFEAGSSLLAEQPNLLDLPKNPDAVILFIKQAQAAFLEHAEAAYIRLYSFWDRVGHVLDFAFFNIRKFDQNGFNAVVDRIHSNAVPMDNRLKNSGSWKLLRSFQISEKENGLNGCSSAATSSFIASISIRFRPMKKVFSSRSSISLRRLIGRSCAQETRPRKSRYSWGCSTGPPHSSTRS